MNEKLYSVREAAAMLPEKFSCQDLYYFLKLKGIVDQNRRPSKEYVDKGVLIETKACRCPYHKTLYPVTKFSKNGIVWLLNEFYPIIISLPEMTESKTHNNG